MRVTAGDCIVISMQLAESALRGTEAAYSRARLQIHLIFHEAQITLWCLLALTKFFIRQLLEVLVEALLLGNLTRLGNRGGRSGLLQLRQV